MKVITKCIVSILLSSFMLVTFSLSVSAEVNSTASNTIIYNGYECYKRGEQYYTLIDGEEYLVLVATEENKVTDPNLIAELENSITRSLNDTIYLSDGTVYESRVDLTPGGYQSPTFMYDVPYDAASSLTLEVDVFFSTTIAGVFYHYNGINDSWHETPFSFNFSVIYDKRGIANSTEFEQTNYCRIRFYKEGTSVDQFDYKFYDASAQ